MRKILCVIVMCILLLSNFVYIYAENNNEKSSSDKTTEEKPNASSEDTSKIEELQNQNQQLQEQIQQYVSDLEVVNEELTSNLQQVQELDKEIENSENELEVLNSEIDELDKSVKENEKKFEKIQKEYKENQKLADERLIIIYESGDVQYLDVLLGSKDIVDLISNYYLITELQKHDFEVLEELNKQKKNQEEITKELEKQENSLNEKRINAQKNSQRLENSKKAREFYLAELSEEEQEIQRQMDEYRMQVALIESEIRKLAVTKSFGENYTGGEMIWPVPGYYRITSQFGARTHPITGVYHNHTGVDVAAPTGTDFLAMADGIVVKAGYNYSYGNMVLIDHGGGVQTLYAHGSQIIAQVGQTVSQGEVVLKSGSTGYSTGPHCHFEVRIDGEKVNPLDYVSPQE